MSLITHPRHGPAGRRAAITIVGTVGLLTLVLSAVEGSDAAPRHASPARLAQRQAASLGRAAAALAPMSIGAMTMLHASVPAHAQAATPDTGMFLLTQAARAARTVSYQGEQTISWRTPGGSWLGASAGSVTVDVWHESGLGTVTRMAAGTRPQETEDPDGWLPDGVLGLPPRLLGLLAAHYAVISAGTGSAGGRSALIVDALRADGSLAARFWLDAASRLPLRRETFGPGARLISDDAFTGLKVGSQAPAAKMPAAQPQAAVLRPWTDHLGLARLTVLRTDGWPVPGSGPAGLTLFDASESATAAGKVIDLSYSDGLSVVSLFIQRGQLPGTLPGWREMVLSGHRVYVRDPAEPSVTWSAGGYVLTVLANAPATVLTQVVDTLPHGTPGFWGRIGHGVRRMLSWVNPFG